MSKLEYLVTKPNAEYLVFNCTEKSVVETYNLKIISYKDKWFINIFVLWLLWQTILKRREKPGEGFDFHRVVDYIASKGKRIHFFDTLVPLLLIRENKKEFYISPHSKACESLAWLIASFGGLSLHPLQLPPKDFDFSYSKMHSLLRQPGVLNTFAWLTNMPEVLIEAILNDVRYTCRPYESGITYVFFKNKQFSLSDHQMVLLVLFSREPEYLLSELGPRSPFVTKLLHLIRLSDEKLLPMLV